MKKLKLVISVILCVISIVHSVFAVRVYGPIKYADGSDLSNFLFLQLDNDIVKIQKRELSRLKVVVVEPKTTLNSIYSKLNSNNYTMIDNYIFSTYSVSDISCDDIGDYLEFGWDDRKVYTGTLTLNRKERYKELLSHFYKEDETIPIEFLPTLMKVAEKAGFKFTCISDDYKNGFNWKNWKKYDYDYYRVNGKIVYCWKE